MARHKDSGDGKQIVGEFPCVICVILRTVLRTVNHEFCPSALKEGFHKVDGETTQSVSMHDHNFFDQASEDCVQKGNKALPFEVDATPDIGDDFVVRERLLEIFALASKVFPLGCGGHASVDDLALGDRGRFSLVAEDFAQVLDVVKPFASRVVSDMTQHAGVRPDAESLLGDVVGTTHNPSGDKGYVMGTFWHCCPGACAGGWTEAWFVKKITRASLSCFKN